MNLKTSQTQLKNISNYLHTRNPDHRKKQPPPESQLETDFNLKILMFNPQELISTSAVLPNNFITF